MVLRCHGRVLAIGGAVRGGVLARGVREQLDDVLGEGVERLITTTSKLMIGEGEGNDEEEVRRE